MIARRTAVLYDAAFQPVGLTSSQFSALRNIYRFVPLGISELADVMLVERTTLTRNLELLRDEGLLTLSASEMDGRVFVPQLTVKGVKTLQTAIPKWRNVQRQFLGAIGTTGWRELLLSLRAVAAINEQVPRHLYVISPRKESGDPSGTAGSEPLDLQRCANSTMRGAARFITREYEAALRPTGLKAPQFHILAAILENDRPRIGDLASLLVLDQSSTTLTVAAMRKKGWIEPKPSKKSSSTHPRGLALTTAGKALLSEATSLWNDVQRAKTKSASKQAMLKWTHDFDRALVAALNTKAQ
jgi:DNA-binding MarR family transcriptional regulator